MPSCELPLTLTMAKYDFRPRSRNLLTFLKSVSMDDSDSDSTEILEAGMQAESVKTLGDGALQTDSGGGMNATGGQTESGGSMNATSGQTESGVKATGGQIDSGGGTKTRSSSKTTPRPPKYTHGNIIA